MNEHLVIKESDLSEAEKKGLGRIVLAIGSAGISNKSNSHTEKLIELSGLFPYLNAVQVGYDSIESRNDTSPLSLFCKVKALQPSHAILDTRFARDNWEGMHKDLIDYEKEVIHKERQIQQREVEIRKQSLGAKPFVLPTPDEVTVDVDVKTSHELLSETEKWLMNSKHGKGVKLAAIVGTSRKPLDQYRVDVDAHALDMVQTIIDADITCARVVAGVCSSRAVAAFCNENSIDASFTGAYLPEYDPNEFYRHEASMDLREVLDVEASFVIGSPIFGSRNPRDALLHHAQILGEN